MTAPGIDVRPDELVRHAGSVKVVSHEVQRAGDGARSNSLNDDVFGIILSFIVGGWFNEKEQDILKKYTDMVDALEGDSDNLRSASRNYVDSDQQATDTVGAVNTRLDLPL
jgi:hypothetical protein